MIIFINEERGYLSWVTHHRKGYVLDGKRKPKLSHLVIHRATCREIKVGPSQRTHWTTGAKLKACSLDRSELEEWACEEAAVLLADCESCVPQNEAAQSDADQIHLSKLAREILEYVLDAALIHLDEETPAYHLTVGDIAACFAKSPAQISPALHRLIDGGLVSVEGKIGPDSPLPPKRVAVPTIAAMKTLLAFQCESDSIIEQELAKLNSA